jgi:XTP/dITP diphosphohydrolase
MSGVRMVLASHNRHKAEELTRLIPGFAIEVFGGEMPEETGTTFRENALIKARHVRERVGDVWVLADDSGISAEALDGAPGVYSARYAGPDATDDANLQKLMDALAGEDDRRVAYVAELVAIDPAGAELHARGELRGTLARERAGDGGFGYDPAFVPEGETRTVAQMDAAEKDAISHRGRAARELARVIAHEHPA